MIFVENCNEKIQHGSTETRKRRSRNKVAVPETDNQRVFRSYFSVNKTLAFAASESAAIPRYATVIVVLVIWVFLLLFQQWIVFVWMSLSILPVAIVDSSNDRKKGWKNFLEFNYTQDDETCADIMRGSKSHRNQNHVRNQSKYRFTGW